ncbi:uncharacterized protein [Blastocystis hominis]|uniref:Uncharacterized protein n=1 Tax=Blastocystis hominis TaxID=12968 RepID=D8M849_BLAHO|nr:uncharacterized protein [Blastocystis hominis]CBK24238.2 unnamed protein product [Blastocystis hominis]|eukprot:XP_012898286.1 uncharacterized protein [Blastocystis hominis]
MEILTGYYPIVLYRDGKQVRLDDANWGYMIEQGYRVRVNSALRRDEIIYGIVEDCLKSGNERPEMPEIFKRVEDWYKQETVCIWNV